MKKSVYSLMLFDEIVKDIDQIACQRDTNRSQLINDILADYLGRVTPEQKVERIITQLEKELGPTLSVSQFNKSSSIQFGKSIAYKYRPKVKYSYAFAGTGEKKYAVLKISSRTKSAALNRLFDEFFEKIEALEDRNQFHCGKCPDGQTSHKFVREFRTVGSVTRDVNEVCRFLSSYLLMIDQAMNLFFTDSDDGFEEALQQLYERYFAEKTLQLCPQRPIDLLRSTLKFPQGGC